MVFGDGDGDLFNRFTTAVDVIGHERAHGVAGDEIDLVYLGQSGAMNESISDVFGSPVKQFHAKQRAAEADWLIGAGLLGHGVQGVALRSLAGPGTAHDGSRARQGRGVRAHAGFVHTSANSGGAHTDSGIPDRAFRLAALALGGFARKRTGRI